MSDSLLVGLIGDNTRKGLLGIEFSLHDPLLDSEGFWRLVDSCFTLIAGE